MYVVYWLETVDEQAVPRVKEFDSNLNAALLFAEMLRKRKYNGEPLMFIDLVSDNNPNSVGKAGVDVTGPDYDWKKRRL